MTDAYRKKRIEVVGISATSAGETRIRLGHPSTLHLWGARRLLLRCYRSSGSRTSRRSVSITGWITWPTANSRAEG